MQEFLLNKKDSQFQQKLNSLFKNDPQMGPKHGKLAPNPKNSQFSINY